MSLCHHTCIRLGDEGGALWGGVGEVGEGGGGGGGVVEAGDQAKVESLSLSTGRAIH